MSGSFLGDEGVSALVSLAGTGRLPLLGDVRVGNEVSSNMQRVLRGVFAETVDAAAEGQ